MRYSEQFNSWFSFHTGCRIYMPQFADSLQDIHVSVTGEIFWCWTTLLTRSFSAQRHMIILFRKKKFNSISMVLEASLCYENYGKYTLTVYILWCQSQPQNKLFVMWHQSVAIGREANTQPLLKALCIEGTQEIKLLRNIVSTCTFIINFQLQVTNWLYQNGFYTYHR